MTHETELSRRMRELSKSRSDLPDEWLDAADKFDRAADGFYSNPQTVTVAQFLGCYARTRKMWCAATGEPLV